MSIPVVWLIPPDSVFEKEWIYHLLELGGIHEIRELTEPVVVQDACALVIFNHSVDYMSYFETCERTSAPFVAVHLSDETLGDDFSFYHFNMCRGVLRNYWHPYASRALDVITFGLGWKTGLRKALADAEESDKRPEYVWSFAGNVYGPETEREKMIRAFAASDMRPYFLYTTTDCFNSPKGLPLCSYAQMLKGSYFVLCPIGQGNVDTFRLYETLEAGAIPVVVMPSGGIQPKNYWCHVFERENLPFVVAENIDSAVKEVHRLMSDPGGYVAKKEETCHFWNRTKAKWGRQLVDFLCNT